MSNLYPYFNIYIIHIKIKEAKITYDMRGVFVNAAPGDSIKTIKILERSAVKTNGENILITFIIISMRMK